MAVTTAPSVEAMKAIVSQLRTATTFGLPASVSYTDSIIDELEEVQSLRLDVVSESEEQLNETLDVEDRTSHVIRVWIRQKVSECTQAEIDRLKLFVRQVFQRLNNFDSSDGRVKVWECDYGSRQVPDKAILRQSSLFVASVVLRVEVEASA